MTLGFCTSTQIRFGQVDAAGITFYPRYFEMLNNAVEDWFAQALGADFRSMHIDRGIGVPTVKLSAEFLSPSMLGDHISITITPVRVGRSSCAFEALFSADGTDILKAEAILVCTDLETRRSVPWPDDIRLRITGELTALA